MTFLFGGSRESRPFDNPNKRLYDEVAIATERSAELQLLLGTGRFGFTFGRDRREIENGMRPIVRGGNAN